MFECKYNEIYTIDKLKDEIVTLKDNEVYRMNDVVKAKLQHKIIVEILKNHKYNGSIMKKYLLKYKKTPFCLRYDKDSNKPYVNSFKYNLLFKELLEHLDTVYKPSDQPIYGTDSLVIHLRLGDLYQKFNDDMNQILSDTNKILDLHTDIKQIVIVTAFHYGQPVEKGLYTPGNYSFTENKNNENFKILRTFISKLKLPVKIESNQDIDRDFCLLSTSEYLLGSFGGFSQLVEVMNSKWKNYIFSQNNNLKYV